MVRVSHLYSCKPRAGQSASQTGARLFVLHEVYLQPVSNLREQVAARFDAALTATTKKLQNWVDGNDCEQMGRNARAVVLCSCVDDCAAGMAYAGLRGRARDSSMLIAANLYRLLNLPCRCNECPSIRRGPKRGSHGSSA